MSKKYNVGDMVWVVGYSDWGVDATECKVSRITDKYYWFGEGTQVRAAKIDSDHIFPTKQECIDYITNSIKVIPYEDTTSV